MQQETAPGLYERDFALWAEQQAAALRAGRLGDLDRENVAEELEGLARGDRREIRNRLVVLEWHLLKLLYQPQQATKSWRDTIFDEAEQIALVLEDLPSLRRDMPALIEAAYPAARRKAARETELPIHTFPKGMEPEIRAAVQSALITGDRVEFTFSSGGSF